MISFVKRIAGFPPKKRELLSQEFDDKSGDTLQTQISPQRREADSASIPLAQQQSQTEILETQLAYWRQQLKGAPPMLQLPTDRPRPAIQTYQGARYTIQLPQTLTEDLKMLSQRDGVTLFMTLLATVNTLLFRYTGQEDLIVGTPIVNQTRGALEEPISFLANTLVLRTDLSGNPSFRELLGREREVVLQAYSHQDLPFERLVEEIQPERDLSYNPLFQVMVTLLDTAKEILDLPGLALNPSPKEDKATPFDMTFAFSETSEGLDGHVEYSSDLFDEPTISRLAGHLQTLLESIVANPEQRVGELPLLTAVERQQLLREWNDTRRDYPLDQCLHQLFEAQVEHTPDNVALIFEGQQFTYRELNQRANQLGHYLQRLGVGPEVLVGICMERSLEMVVGLLGILKAGGAYVPFDPTYPRERLTFMLQDAQVPILLAQERLRTVLPEHQARVIYLDTDCQSFAHEPGDNPASGARPDNLAYVIYTSGSTGKPKGAMNTHRGICNRLLWMQEAYQLQMTDRVLQKTPFSFDVSVWEFFWPLLYGAQLVIARPEGHRDSAYLVKLIVEQQITTLHFVPSMLRIFLEERDVEKCTSLRQIICSGEALPFELQKRFFERLGAALHNLYGPTEASVDVTYWACERESKLQVVPIGRPIANIQIYLLDAYLNPVPIGVSGELYIGGIGLGRGYLHRSDLTAEKFIANPFSDVPGALLYKTGDLALYLPDGAIEYLGRNDHQVKIRGFRIELGEIEALLATHPAVHDCIVVAREDVPGDKRLVAYIVAKQEQLLEVSEVRRFLSEQLPGYMVPSSFVLLEALALSPNGKVDRKALPPPDATNTMRDEVIATPSMPIERRVIEIVAPLLSLEQIGIDDNFFLLGGNSLMGTQIIMRLADAFGVDLPLRTLFNAPTVRLLSAEIEQLIVAKLETLNEDEIRLQLA